MSNKIEEQKSLLTYICTEEGHEFQVPLGTDGYYKQDQNEELDKTKVFRIMVCPKCGEVREICVVDRTPISIEKKKVSRRKR